VHLFSTHIDEEESSFLSREEDFDYEYYKKLGQSKKVIAVGGVRSGFVPYARGQN
jgi:hypothetical protein